MAEITLTPGQVALVDDADVELVSGKSWCAHKTRAGWYACWSTHQAGKPIHVFMHVLLVGYVGVDHRNGNGLDNRRENLRPATQTQQLANSRPRAGGSSKYKGVWRDSATRSSKKWRAAITKGGHSRNLGRFMTEVEAAKAYNVAAVDLFGEYARLNDV